MAEIDLNADLGEADDLPGALAVDVPLLEVVTSANVATGAHAGGGQVLAVVAEHAVAAGVSVGAHPSYRDRVGFGRRSQLAALHGDQAAGAALVADLVGQIELLAVELARFGATVRHVKPHGALYNDAVADPVAADLVVAAVAAAGERLGQVLAVVTLPTGWLWQRCAEAGIPVWAEGFIDRAYTPAGTLVPRSEPGAVLHDHSEMVANALALAAGTPSTLCVHGDTPGALAAARAVRQALNGAGWTVAPLPSVPR